MPATGKTPIQFYRSTTSGNVPSAANLSPGELALNIADTDMTMYFENASGVVKRFFNNPAELKYPTADGTSGQGVKTDGSKTLSFGSLASAAITNNTRQAVTSSATTTIDLASGQVIDLTMSANITTLSFTNVPASGTPVLVQIVVKNASSGTAYTIAWPNSVYWSGQYTPTTFATLQTAPTLASGANGVTTIALLTTDGGTKWRGWVEALIPGGASGGIYSWGDGASGKLGQNSTANLSSPVQVGALTNWVSVTAGGGYGFCAAIKTDGTLWTWGFGGNGRLGQSSTANLSSPVQVGALTDWSSVSAGYDFCAAIKTNGTLWSWGRNNRGQLGQNDALNRSSPVQVGALTNWQSVSSSVFNRFCTAVKTDGTLWSWGAGNYGNLGQNSTLDAISPIQVGALTDWKSVSAGSDFCAAIKTNGTLWTWGAGSAGRLGQNSTTSLSSPIQVGALTDWSKLSAGYNCCTAIKTNDTLWSWGQNANGQLGQNNTVVQSSPVQVGALTNWASVSTGGFFSTAVKTNGTLWTWGQGASGQLGQNSTTTLSSPVQVGALTTWLSVSTSSNSCISLIGSNINPA